LKVRAVPGFTTITFEFKLETLIGAEVVKIVDEFDMFNHNSSPANFDIK